VRVRSLSTTEARVILSAEADGREEISLSAIQRYAGVRRGFARKLAHTLLVKGWVQRIGRGRYLLNPASHGADAIPDTDPLRVGSRLVRPYYFGYATAAELWGFLLQPGRVYYLVTPTRTSIRVAGPAQFRLVRVAPRRFFGSAPMERRQQSITVSDVERTVLDCIDRPEFSGGIGGAAQVVARAKRRMSWDRVAEYLDRLGRRSLAARFGFLAERVRPEWPPPSAWVKRFLPRPDDPWVPLGPPRAYGRSGPRDSRWHIIQNVPDRQLFAEADAQ
jgi:predicted transcriptional regulator of viral defense system